MKRKFKFRPIGEEFKVDEVTLKVVQSRPYDCTGCFFEDVEEPGCLCSNKHGTGDCGMYLREDKKSVIFKNVTTNGHND